jgi:hypothetical protein
MSQNKAILSGSWEFHIVNGLLFIISKDDPGHQVQLTGKEAFDLLEYLYQHMDELYDASHPKPDQQTKEDL